MKLTFWFLFEKPMALQKGSKRILEDSKRIRLFNLIQNENFSNFSTLKSKLRFHTKREAVRRVVLTQNHRTQIEALTNSGRSKKLKIAFEIEMRLRVTLNLTQSRIVCASFRSPDFKRFKLVGSRGKLGRS